MSVLAGLCSVNIFTDCDISVIFCVFAADL